MDEVHRRNWSKARTLPGLLWIDLSPLAKLFGSLTVVRVVLHGLRRSRLVDRRLGGETTGSGGICHLLGEYTIARPVRLQSRPVSRPGQQRFVLDDGLVDQDFHSTLEIVLRLENGFGRIVRLKRTVHLPIEIAAVTLLVGVRKLQQSFTADDYSAFRLVVTDAGIRIQSGFSTGKRLEEVGPKCAFICCAHVVKSRAESAHATGDLRRKHFGWQRFLDDVPLWIPGRPSEFDLLHVDRGWRGWLDGLRMRSCGYWPAKCETHDEPRCLQHKDTHVQPPPRIDPTHCHSSRDCSALGSDRRSCRGRRNLSWLNAPGPTRRPSRMCRSRREPREGVMFCPAGAHAALR